MVIKQKQHAIMQRKGKHACLSAYELSRLDSLLGYLRPIINHAFFPERRKKRLRNPAQTYGLHLQGHEGSLWSKSEDRSDHMWHSLVGHDHVDCYVGRAVQGQGVRAKCVGYYDHGECLGGYTDQDRSKTKE